MPSNFRSFDTFVKPVDDVRLKTSLGGVITLVASTVAALLFLSQLYLYAKVDVKHTLHLAESASDPMAIFLNTAGNIGRGQPAAMSEARKRKLQQKHQILVRAHVTFPHVQCKDLDYTLDGKSFSAWDMVKIHGRNPMEKRIPSLWELKAILGRQAASALRKDGCTIDGEVYVPKVGGNFAITIKPAAWQSVATKAYLGLTTPGTSQFFNVSHYIHAIEFGEPFPLQKNPLEKAWNKLENEMGGVGVNNIHAKLVPTIYKRFVGYPRKCYQISATSHLVQPAYLQGQQNVMPGLNVGYDFTPLAVHHVEHRENLFVFLSSLVSIVGGCFVVVGLVTGCLVHSAAAAVSKKID